MPCADAHGRPRDREVDDELADDLRRDDDELELGRELGDAPVVEQPQRQ